MPGPADILPLDQLMGFPPKLDEEEDPLTTPAPPRFVPGLPGAAQPPAGSQGLAFDTFETVSMRPEAGFFDAMTGAREVPHSIAISEVARRARWSEGFVDVFIKDGPQGQMQRINRALLAPPVTETAGEKFRRGLPRSVEEVLELAPHIETLVGIQELRDFKAAAEAMEVGTDTDLDRLRVFAFFEKMQRDPTLMAQVMGIAAESARFAVEIGLTGGTFTAVRLAAKKAATAGMKRVGVEIAGRTAGAIAARAAIGTAGVVAGGAVQSLLSPRWVESTIQLGLPELSLDEQGQVLFDFENTDSLFERSLRGITDTMIEYISERAAIGFRHVGTGVANRASARFGLKMALVRKYMEKVPKGGPTVQSMLRRGAWDGMVLEMGEELVGDMARVASGLMPFDDLVEQYGDLQNVLAMAIAFALPGSAIAGAEGLKVAGRATRAQVDPAGAVEDRFTVAEQFEIEVEARHAQGIPTPLPGGSTRAQELFQESGRDAVTFARLQLLERGGPYSDEEQDLLDSTDAEAEHQGEISYEELSSLNEADRLGEIDNLTNVLQSGINPITREPLTDSQRGNLSQIITTLQRQQRQNNEPPAWVIPEPGVPTHGPIREPADGRPSTAQDQRDRDQADAQRQRQVAEGGLAREEAPSAEETARAEEITPQLSIIPGESPKQLAGRLNGLFEGGASLRTLVEMVQKVGGVSQNEALESAIEAKSIQEEAARTAPRIVGGDVAAAARAERPGAREGRRPGPVQREGAGVDQGAVSVAFERGSGGVFQPVLLTFAGHQVEGDVLNATEATRAKLLSEGTDVVPIIELTGGERGAAYAALLNSAAHSNRFGAAVEQKAAEELEAMRLFITPDGLAGAALTPDGDMVALFKHRKSEIRGVAKLFLPMMIERGGRTLDAFDTILPHLYGAMGMRAVARTPFVDEFAPPGWDFDLFKRFNGGRPDIVFMVFDGNPSDVVASIGATEYTPGEGETAADFDAAKAIQQAAVAEVVQLQRTVRAPTGGQMTESLLERFPVSEEPGNDGFLLPTGEFVPLPVDMTHAAAAILAGKGAVDLPMFMHTTGLVRYGSGITARQLTPVLFEIAGPLTAEQMRVMDEMTVAQADVGIEIAVTNQFGREIGFLQGLDVRRMIRAADNIATQEIDSPPNLSIVGGLFGMGPIAPAVLANDLYTAPTKEGALYRLRAQAMILGVSIDEADNEETEPVTDEQKALAAAMDKLGTSFGFMRNKHGKQIAGGMYDPLSRSVWVDVNHTSSTDALIEVFTHEWTHFLRGSDRQAWNTFIARIKEADEEGLVNSGLVYFAASRGIDLSQAPTSQQASDFHHWLNSSLGENEATSTYVGTHMFSPLFYERVLFREPHMLELFCLKLGQMIEALGEDHKDVKVLKAVKDLADAWFEATKTPMQAAADISATPSEPQLALRGLDTEPTINSRFKGRKVSSIVVRALVGREKLDITATGVRGETRVADLARALDARSLKLGQRLERVRGSRVYEGDYRERLINEILDEVEAGEGTLYDATGWYDARMAQMIKSMGRLFPELKVSKGHQAIFKFLVAITSNGNKVDRNLNATRRIYDLWRTSADKQTLIVGDREYPDVPVWGTGWFPTVNDVPLDVDDIDNLLKLTDDSVIPRTRRGEFKSLPRDRRPPSHASLERRELGGYLWSYRGWAIRKELRILNRLMNTKFKPGRKEDHLVSLSEWVDWLLEEQTVKQIRGDADIGKGATAVSEESVTMSNRRVLYLGPKVGVFFQNMMGFTDLLTMDIWFARTWNRMTGTLMLTPDQRAQAVAEAHARIRGLTVFQFKAEAHGFDFEEVRRDEATAIEWARVADRAIQKANGATKSEKTKAAVEKMRKADEGVVATPGGGTERQRIREVFDEMLDRLHERGRRNGNAALESMTMSDVQAILWYSEQRFYTEFGASRSQTTIEDFGDAADRIVQSTLAAQRRDVGAAAVARRRGGSIDGRRGRAGRGAVDRGAEGLVEEAEDDLVQLSIQRPADRGIDIPLEKARTLLLRAGFSEEDAAELTRIAAVDVMNSQRRRLSVAIESLSGLGTKTLQAGVDLLSGAKPITGGQRSLFSAPARPGPGRPRAPSRGPKVTRAAAARLKAVIKGTRAGRREGVRAGRAEGVERERQRAINRQGQILERIFGPVRTNATGEELQARDKALKARKPEQIMRAALSIMRLRAAAARRKLAQDTRRGVQANLQAIKDDIRLAVRASGLPTRLHGRFLGDITEATTRGAVSRALRKIEFLSARVRFEQAVSKLIQAENAAKRKGRKQLGNVERAQIEAIVQSAAPAAFSKGRRRRSYDTLGAYDMATADIERNANAIQEILANRAAELKGIRADRIRSRDEHIAEIRSHLGWDEKTKKYKKQLKGRGKKLQDLEKRWLKRGVELRWYYDTETLTRRAEKKWFGDGVLTALLSRIPKQAEDQYNADLRDEMSLLEAFVQENTKYATLSEAFMRMMGTFGDSSLEVATVTVGGEQQPLSMDSIAELLALDQQTLDKIGKGRPIEFADATHRVPIPVTVDEIETIREQFADLMPLIEAMKARLETSIRPRAFAVHRELKGWEPVEVLGYWPSKVDVAGSNEMGVAEAFRGGSPSALMTRYYENAGFFKEREESSTAPFIIHGLLSTYMSHLDQTLKVIHMAVPLRNAAAVLLNTVTRDAVAATSGASLYKQLKRHLVEISMVNRDTAGGAERFLRIINSNMVASYLTTNPGTFIRQIGGLSKVWARMPTKYFIIGMARMRPGTLKEMIANSGFFSARYSGDSYARFSPLSGSGIDGLDHVAFTQSVAALLRAGVRFDLRGTGKSWQRVLRSIKLLDWFDAINARVAWEGFKAQAKAEGKDLAWVAEQTAFVIRSTQNTSSPLDAGSVAMESKNSLLRYWLLFTTDPMKSLNMLIQGFHQGPKQAAKDSIGVAINIYWSGIVTTRGIDIGSDLIGAAIGSLFGGDDDDASRLARQERSVLNARIRIMRDALGTLPIIGDFIAEGIDVSVRGFGGGYNAPLLEMIEETIGKPLRMAADAIGDMSEDKAEETFEKIFAALVQLSAGASKMAGNPFLMPYYRGKRIAEATGLLPEEEASSGAQIGG